MTNPNLDARRLKFGDEKSLKGEELLKRDDILVVDNSQVHRGGEAQDLEDYLWNAPSPIDGQPFFFISFLLALRN